MKHFRMSFSDSQEATYAVWGKQCQSGSELTRFSTSSVGADTSICTKDEASEHLLRTVLQELHIHFTESNEQQVRTGFE